MVIVNPENYVDEVAPECPSVSIVQVCTICSHFTFPLHERDWDPLQSCAGANR